VPYLSASAVVIHYEETLCQVSAPLPLHKHNKQKLAGHRCRCRLHSIFCRIVSVLRGIDASGRLIK